MNFAFSEDQEMIRKSAADFVKGESSIERIRELHDDELGYSKEVYGRMAESGWLGCVYPEQYGGIDLGYVDLVCIQEELGRGLMPEPLVASAVAGGNCVLFGCNASQKEDILPQVAAGELVLTLAAYEMDGRFDPAYVATTAKNDGSDYVLNGSKSFVSNVAGADKIVLSARTSGATADRDGITLFLVDTDAAGLGIQPISTIDYQRRAMLELKDVRVPESAIVGSEGKGYDAVDKAIDRATVALCAEMVGGMDYALQASVAYSKERIQFGKPIGSFQAIKHKAANMYVEIEAARSALYYAAMAVDEEMPEMKAAISTAKALCSDAYLHVSKEAIQIHGGIGFTDEHEIHLYYKRALATGVTFGDASYHRDRYATEKGF